MTRRGHTRCWGVFAFVTLSLAASTAWTRPINGARPALVPPGVEPTRAQAPPALPLVQPGTPVPSLGVPVKLSPPPAPTAPYVEVWSHRVEAAAADVVVALTPAAVVSGGKDIPLEARDLKTGDLVWSVPTSVSMLAYDSGVLYGLGPADVFAADVRSGDLLWKIAADSPGHGLAVGPGLVVVVSTTGLRALSRTDGSTLWQADLAAPPATAVDISDTLVLVGLADRAMVVLERATGVERFRFVFDTVPRTITAIGPVAYVTLPRMAVCAVTLDRGQNPWCTTLIRVPSVGPPRLFRGRLYVALADTTLRQLDASTGTMLDNVPLSGRAVTPPLHIGPHLVVPLVPDSFAVVSADGRLAVLSPTGDSTRRSLRDVVAAADVAGFVAVTVAMGAVGDHVSLTTYLAP